MQSALLSRCSAPQCRLRGYHNQPAAAGLRRPTVIASRGSFAARAEVQDQAKDAVEKVEEGAQKAEQAVKENVPTGSGGGFQDRVDQAGREISAFTQEASGLTKDNTTIKSSQADGKPAFEEAMSFSGQVPERANSRLAMLAFMAAAGAEIATGAPLAAQIKKSPFLIGATFIVFIVASIIPIVRGEDPNKQSGPFTVRAELWNGRLAMLGFIALILTETFRGGAAL